MSLHSAIGHGNFMENWTDTLGTKPKMSQSDLAVSFFALSVAALSLAGLTGWGLTQLFPQAKTAGPVRIPAAFGISTILLFAGSRYLSRAIQAVKLERQLPFRRALWQSLVCGTLFVGLQSFGLWCLIPEGGPAEASTGVKTFIFVFAVLHALHLSVALLFLVYVTLKATQDRYDHEYYWGVTFCAYFWHFLGIVWVAILFVFLIAML